MLGYASASASPSMSSNMSVSTPVYGSRDSFSGNDTLAIQQVSTVESFDGDIVL
jgi:hypothetical protein